jgi:hypothetical protein
MDEMANNQIVFGLVALGVGVVWIGVGAWYMTHLPEWKRYRIVNVFRTQPDTVVADADEQRYNV